MQRKILIALLLVAWLSLGSRKGLAQEVVHALTGTVSAADRSAHTITVKTDDGSEGLFKDMGTARTNISFDKGLEEQATPAEQFTAVGSHVIVYYFGDGDVRTAVAIKDLGSTSVHESAGTVANFDRHRHVITLKDSSGQMEEFAVGEQTCVDTPDDVLQGLKYRPGRGDHVHVAWTAENGQNTALFISAN